jgi:hypothetical protein
MTTWRQGVLGLAVAVVTLPSVVLASPPEPPPGTGIEPGDWVGEAVLEGVSRTTADGLAIEFVARFDLDFGFQVDIAGSASGDWTSTGNGTMTIDGGSAGVLEQTYDGGGEVFTVGDEMSFGGMVTRVGTFVVEGQRVPIDVTEETQTLSIVVDGSSCQEAWGSIDQSYEGVSEEYGLVPEWTGPWFAVMDGSALDDRADLVPALNQIIADHERLLAGRTAPQIASTVVPALWDLVQRALPLLNELRNLGECARRLLDDDQLEHWENLLSNAVRNSILAAITAAELNGYELYLVVDAGFAANAFSPNIPQPELTEAALDAIAARAQEVIAEVIIAEGDEYSDGSPCTRSPGCFETDSWYPMYALVVAKRLGLDVVYPDGRTESAADILAQGVAAGRDIEAEVAENRAQQDGDG